jgi:hypothetical protein
MLRKKGSPQEMAEHVALKLGRSKKLALVAVAWMAVVAPFASGQGKAAPEGQAVTPIPQWQTAAGGKMTFEVASIRPSKPDTFTPPNFALSSDDSYLSTGGIFNAIFLWPLISSLPTSSTRTREG